jgi:adenine phosphoribosyltransferase
MALVELYKGQTSYTTKICGLTRVLPLRKVDKDMWIASNHQLVLGCDVEFTKFVGKELAKRIRKHKPDCLLTAESKSLPLVYETAKNLRHKKIAVARKSPKAYMDFYIEERVKSITTKEPQRLVLDKENIKLIKNKKICIIDDVVSTGGTINALERLAKKARAKIECKAAVWLEGPWYKGDLIYLSTLPIFVTKEKYSSYTKLLEKI